MGDELKPCPFCGSKPTIHTWPAGTINIMCSDRDCPVHVEFETGEPAEAITAWNTRTETQSQATIDELVGALRRLQAAEEIAVVQHQRQVADDLRIKQLEGAIQEMCAAIRDLEKQGEDRIWRPVKRALEIADRAIAPDTILSRHEGGQS